MSSPSCPCVTVGLVAAGIGDDGSAELPQQLRHGDGDQLKGARVAVEGALEGSGDGEEDMGEQGDGGPAVPGGPGGDLPGVQARDLLGQLVIFLSQPLLMPVKEKLSLALRRMPGRCWPWGAAGLGELIL